MHKNKNIYIYFLIFQCFDKNWVFNITFVSIRYKNTNQYYTKFSRKIRGKITDFFLEICFSNGQTWSKKKLGRDQPNKNAHNLTLGWTQSNRMDWADDLARTGYCAHAQ